MFFCVFFLNYINSKGVADAAEDSFTLALRRKQEALAALASAQETFDSAQAEELSVAEQRQEMWFGEARTVFEALDVSSRGALSETDFR